MDGHLGEKEEINEMEFTNREQIKTYQSVMSFRANNKNGIQLDGVSSNSNTEGNLRQHYSTDSGSYKRYTATLNPRIAEVGLQGYWDPTKANSYSGNTVYDFSPADNILSELFFFPGGCAKIITSEFKGSSESSRLIEPLPPEKKTPNMVSKLLFIFSKVSKN